MSLPAQADLLVWLRADTTLYQVINAHTTPATADGNPIGTWADRSGNGRDCSPDVNGNRPTLKLGIYGSKQVVRFVSTAGQGLAFGAGAFTGVTAAEMFVVVKKTANSDGKGICWFDDSGNINAHRYTDNHIYDGFCSTSRADAGTGGADFSTAFRVYNVISVSGEFTVNLDASQVFTRASNTVGVPGFPQIGGGGGSSFVLNGDIAEFVIYNRKLTSPERTAALAYFTDDASWVDIVDTPLAAGTGSYAETGGADSFGVGLATAGGSYLLSSGGGSLSGTADIALHAGFGPYTYTGGAAALTAPFAPFAAGVLSAGTASVAVTAADATGGTGPYAYQWESSTDGGVTWGTATGTGTTTLSAVLTGLAINTVTWVRVRYTDSATPAVIVYAPVQVINTSNRRRRLRWFRQLGMRR